MSYKTVAQKEGQKLELLRINAELGYDYAVNISNKFKELKIKTDLEKF